MIQIVSYKVPGTVTRDPSSGIISLVLDEEKRTPHTIEKLADGANVQNLPSYAQKVAKDNDTQRSMASNMLLRGQDKAEVVLTLKYIEGTEE